MDHDAQTGLVNILTDNKQIPRLFANYESGPVFHKPATTIEILGLEDLEPGTTLLDIGTGTGALVNELTSKGISAIGIDFMEEGLPQNPNVVADSIHLPFPNNSFDIVTNFWGGLSYPIETVTSINEYPEIQKQFVVKFLQQLKEAIRVSKSGVRIYPWSGTHFYELAGIRAFAGEWGDISFLAIDFDKLFNEMGLETTVGPILNEGTEARGMRSVSINISNTDKADLKPLEKLINIIESSDKKLTFSKHELREDNQELANAIESVVDNQGVINDCKKRIEQMVDALKRKDYTWVYPEHNDTQKLKEMGIDLNNKASLANALIEIKKTEIEKVKVSLQNSINELKEQFEPFLASKIINN